MAAKANLLYYLRCFQLSFALAFLIVICYSGVHRGWWDNVTGAIALGVITSLITLLIIGHAVFTQYRNNPFNTHGSIYQISRLVIEALTFLLWVATVVLMLRHKGGCDGDRSVVIDGVRFCHTNVTLVKLYSDRPNTPWLCGLAFAFVDLVTFIMSIFLVYKDNRANKVGEGTSYA